MILDFIMASSRTRIRPPLVPHLPPVRTRHDTRLTWFLALLVLAGIAPRRATAAEEPAVEQVHHRGEIVGVFQDVHVRPDETTNNVVAIFGSTRVEGPVRDSAVSIFGAATILSPVEGDVITVFGDCTIAEDVSGDVVCVFGALRVESGVTIHGDLVSVGGPAHLADTARVRGEMVPVPIPAVRLLGPWVRENLLRGRLYPHDDPATWTFVGVMLVFSLLGAAIFRRPVNAGVDVLTRRPGSAFAHGLLGAILVPPALFLLLVTVVGVLALPFAWAGILIATFLGVVALHRFCGAQLGIANPTLALVLGHVLFSALYALPYLGFLIWGGVMTFGFGITLTAWGEARRERRVNGAAKRGRPPPATDSPSVPASAPAPVGLASPPPTPAPISPGAAFAPPIEATAPEPGRATATREDAEPPSTETSAPPQVTAAPGVQPAAALPPTIPTDFERADFWPRLGAAALDFALIAVVHGLILPFVPFLALWFVYHIAFWAWRGTTLGGVVLNLRIVRLDGRTVDLGVAIVRALGAVMSFLPAGLGFLWVIWDAEKQSWHDKIAGTVIARLPRGQPLI